MDTHALHHHHHTAVSGLTRWIVIGFVAGAVSVLVFHQGLLALLHGIGAAQRAPFAFTPTAPFGVPQLWSLVFWGGLWGALLAASVARTERMLPAATLFGAILPTLAAWFIVAPLKGQPMAAGGVAAAMAIGALLNAAWGFGTGVGLMLFGRRR
jgi:hypothetical protein